MADNSAPLFDQPVQPSTQEAGERYYSMPKEFRGVRDESVSPTAQPPKVVPAPVSAVKTATPVLPPAQALQKPMAKKRPPVWLLILIALIGALVIVTIVLLVWPKPSSTPNPPHIGSDNPPVIDNNPNPPPMPPDPPPAPPEPPKEPQNPFDVELRAGIDFDSDGLTNVEESLFGTSASRPDSDGDGYLDGNEVYHLYDPIEKTPAKLVNSRFISSYTSSPLLLSFYLPTTWQVLKDPKDARGLIVQSVGPESVSMIRIANPQKLSLKAFVKQLDPSAPLDQFTDTVTKNGFDEIYSENHFVAYVLLKDSVVKILYDAGTKPTADYASAFRMMINSLLPSDQTYVEPVTAIPTPVSDPAVVVPTPVTSAQPSL